MAQQRTVAAGLAQGLIHARIGAVVCAGQGAVLLLVARPMQQRLGVLAMQQLLQPVVLIKVQMGQVPSMVVAGAVEVGVAGVRRELNGVVGVQLLLVVLAAK